MEYDNHNKSMEEQKKKNKESDIWMNKLEENEKMQKINQELAKEHEEIKNKKVLLLLIQEEELNQHKEDLLKNIEVNKIEKEKQAKQEKISILKSSNPFIYRCNHGPNSIPCASCNKIFPEKLMMKRSISQNSINQILF